jgi:hypothetical protein
MLRMAEKKFEISSKMRFIYEKYGIGSVVYNLV